MEGPNGNNHATPNSASLQWFCHACSHSTSHPTRDPELRCDRCYSDFMEELEPGDPRRDEGFPLPDLADGDADAGPFGGTPFATLLRAFAPPAPPQESQQQAPQQPRQPGGFATTNGTSTNGTSYSFSISTMGPSGVHTRQFYGPDAAPNTRPAEAAGTGAGPGPIRTLSDFLNEAFTSAQHVNQLDAPDAADGSQVAQPGAGPAEAPRGPVPNLAQMLFSLLGGGSGGQPFHVLGGIGGDDAGPFGLGDYVFTQEGLDRVVQRLFEQNAGGSGPTPASEETISALPRRKLAQEDLASPDIQDCAVCKDSFVADDATLQLPCKHYFHEDCITPWLKTSATCPICRFNLNQPAAGQADGQPRPDNQPNALEGEDSPSRTTMPGSYIPSTPPREPEMDALD